MKIKFLIFSLAAKAWDDCPSDISDYPSGFHDGWGHWYHLVDENYGVGPAISEKKPTLGRKIHLMVRN